MVKSIALNSIIRFKYITKKYIYLWNNWKFNLVKIPVEYSFGIHLENWKSDFMNFCVILDEEMDDFDGNEIDLSICLCDMYN